MHLSSRFKKFAFGSLFLALTGILAGPAAAVFPDVSITFEPATVNTPGSFAAVLNASVPGDVLLALDVAIVFADAMLAFEGYATSGTMTAGFSAVPMGLASATASLAQGGQLSPAESGAVIRALLMAPAVASSTPTTVRFFGTLGLDQAGEVPFDVSRQLVLSPVPEPATWLNLLVALMVIVMVASRTIPSSGNATANDESMHVSRVLHATCSAG